MKTIAMILACLLTFSCNSTTADKNASNIAKVKEGMSLQEATEIMGAPEKVIVYPHDSSVYNLMYEAPFGMSDNYYIIVSKKDSVVTSINRGE